MARKRHTAADIINKLREADAAIAKGTAVSEVCRELGVTERTYYRWRKEYGGLSRAQAKRLRELEQENARLKKLVPDISLDNAILRAADHASSTVLTPRLGDAQAQELVPTQVYAAEPRVRLMGEESDLRGLNKHRTEIPADMGLSFIETQAGTRKLVSIQDVSGRESEARVLERERGKLEAGVEQHLHRRRPYGLTFRERTVLKLLSAGGADKEIAAQLAISRHTVHKHVGRILLKMSVSCRTEAGVRAAKEGLLDWPAGGLITGSEAG